VWTLSHDDLVTAREEAKREAEQFGGNTAYQRLGRAHLWLDELDEARRAFAVAADDVRTRVIERGRGKPSTWNTYGLLLRRAGDEAGAREAFERAGRVDDERRTLTREEIVKLIRAERMPPDATAPALTLYDLLEATFPEGTSHIEMLREAGLLGDATPRPTVEAPPVGRWTVRDAVLENDGEGPVVAHVGGLRVEFIEAFGEWEVRVEGLVTGMHATFGEAVDAAIDALRAHDDGEYAVAALTDLLQQRRGGR
jgi:hypothetical protein